MRISVTVLVLTLAGCGTALPSGTPAPTPTPASTPSPTSTPQPSSSSSTVIDPSLLDHLPSQVDGLDVMRSPESDAVAAADPVVRQFGEGVATALSVDVASGDFAYATVVRLRPSAFSEELYRSWRDSFDEGACSQAGGVVRTAEVVISGREVHIDTCQGGVRTYHVWLANSRILISVSAAGERRLGEALVAGVRD